MLGLSLAATITTVPLIAFHFERVSTLGIPASVLTLPVLPFLIVGNAGTALVGLGEYCVRYAVRLAGMGRWGVPIRSGYALGTTARRFG